MFISATRGSVAGPRPAPQPRSLSTASNAAWSFLSPASPAPRLRLPPVGLAPSSLHHPSGRQEQVKLGSFSRAQDSEECEPQKTKYKIDFFLKKEMKSIIFTSR